MCCGGVAPCMVTRETWGSVPVPSLCSHRRLTTAMRVALRCFVIACAAVIPASPSVRCRAHVLPCVVSRVRTDGDAAAYCKPSGACRCDLPHANYPTVAFCRIPPWQPSNSSLTTPPPLGDCDAGSLKLCGSALTTCIMSNPRSPSAICDCRGTYDKCVLTLGCPAATVAAVVASCEEAGCTAAQCAAS